MKARLIALTIAGFAALAAHQAMATEPVTVDNFVRAESDLYLGSTIKDAGGIGNFCITVSRRRSTNSP